MKEAVREPAADEVRALTARITASAPFQRSPRLVELFTYIVESALREPPQPLSEHQIGVAIFRRLPQYDSTSDTIVRVQVSQLRRKLEHYFLTDGEKEPVVIEIPRGSYNPVFHWQVGEEPAEPSQPRVSDPAPAGNRRLVIWLGLATALGILMGWLLFGPALRTPDGQSAGPVVQSFWANLIRAGQKTDIIVGDSVFAFMQDGLGAPLDLDRYMERDPQQWLESGKLDPSAAALLKRLAHRQYTSFADLAVVKRILFLNPALEPQISIVFARNYHARAAVTNNLILLGSRRSNPWVQLYAERLNFWVDFDEVAQKSVIRNRNPRSGEASVYTVAGEGAGIKEGYALIAYLPNAQRSARTLILAGTHMEATEAVGQLATTEAGLQPVLSRIGGSGPTPYFEALFRTRRLGGAPASIELSSWRVHPK